MSNIIKNSRKIFTGEGYLSSSVALLSNNEYKITYYEVVSGTAGSLTLPTGATINAGEFSGNNSIISEVDGANKPTFVSPKTAGGTVITSTLNTGTGAWTISGTPTVATFAFIYSIKIKAINYSNLTYTNIIESEELDGNKVYTTPLQYTSSTDTVSILQSSAVQSGFLSNTDWSTFNGKQAALSGTGVVKSTTGTISYINGTSAQFIKGDGSLDGTAYGTGTIKGAIATTAGLIPFGTGTADTVTTDTNFRITNTGNQQGLIFGGTNVDVWLAGVVTGKFLTIQTTTDNEPSILNVAASGTGTAAVNYGNATIRRAAINVMDGSHLTFWTNNTNTGTGVFERMRILNTGELLVGATALAAASHIADFRKDQNAITRVTSINATSGTTAIASLASSVSATLATQTTIGSLSAGYTTSGMFVANSGFVFSNMDNGLNVGTNKLTDLSLWTNSIKRMEFNSVGNMAFGATSSYGSGVGVFFIANATTVPTTNPTGGGIIYVEAGALKYRGSSGTITTLGLA